MGETRARSPANRNHNCDDDAILRHVVARGEEDSVGDEKENVNECKIRMIEGENREEGWMSGGEEGGGAAEDEEDAEEGKGGEMGGEEEEEEEARVMCMTELVVW